MKKMMKILALGVCFLSIAFSQVYAATEKKTFSVSGDQTLLLEDLIAKVSVKRGTGNRIVVSMTGGKAVKEITVKQYSQGVSVKGHIGARQGGTSFSMGASVNAVIVSDGDINIESDSDVIIVNGQRIKGTKREVVTISIEVPARTSIEISSVKQVTVSGLGGKINAHVAGGSRLDASDAVGIKLKCSGQSECKISNASGDTRMTASGQSSIHLAGKLGDVEADASGQSEISINGNCHNLDADASGQSEIVMRGKVSGTVHKRQSGQSEISIR